MPSLPGPSWVLHLITSSLVSPRSCTRINLGAPLTPLPVVDIETQQGRDALRERENTKPCRAMLSKPILNLICLIEIFFLKCSTCFTLSSLFFPLFLSHSSTRSKSLSHLRHNKTHFEMDKTCTRRVSQFEDTQTHLKSHSSVAGHGTDLKLKVIGTVFAYLTRTVEGTLTTICHSHCSQHAHTHIHDHKLQREEFEEVALCYELWWSLRQIEMMLGRNQTGRALATRTPMTLMRSMSLLCLCAHVWPHDNAECVVLINSLKTAFYLCPSLLFDRNVEYVRTWTH